MRSFAMIVALTAWLLLGIGGAVATAESLPTSPLYEGAVGLRFDPLVQKSPVLENTETHPEGPFRAVAKRVEEITGLQVWLNEQAIRDAGADLSYDTGVPEWPAGETIAQYSGRLTPGTDLAWYVNGRLATLTTREAADEVYVTRQYQVTPLLKRMGSYQQLFDAIEHSTSHAWENDEPGTGTLALFNGVLVVRQTHEVQREVAEILAGLDRSDRVVLIECSSRELEIRRLLEERVVNFESGSVTLAEFCEYFEGLTGVRFRLDEIELNNAGLDSQTEISPRAIDLPLGVVLEQLNNVNGTDLATIVRDDQCLITTAEKAAEIYETAIYNVGLQGITGPRIKTLVATLEQQTSGPWDADEPGTGTICSIDSLGVLVVRQTQSVHREILALLRGLREPVPANVTALTADSVPAVPPATGGLSPLESVVSTVRVNLPASEGAIEFEISKSLLLALILGGVAGFLGRNCGTKS